MYHWKRKAGFVAAVVVISWIGTYSFLTRPLHVEIYPQSTSLKSPRLKRVGLPWGHILIDNMTVVYDTESGESSPELQSPPRLFFNRVPKCGSSSINALVIAMRERNRFFYKVSINYTDGAKHIDTPTQRALVSEFLDHRAPLIYNRHVHYINFTRLDSPQPLYFNIIRDPMQRFMSSFHFRIIRKLKSWNFNSPNAGEMRRAAEEEISRLNVTFDECVLEQRTLCNQVEDYFVLIPFFCGQDEMCLTPSPASLAAAQYNLVTHYVLVGLTEDMLTFVEGLEQLLPRFFKGARDWFSAENPRENAYAGEKKYNQTTQDFMSSRLTEEYEFYNFAKQIFYEKVKTWRKVSGVPAS